MEKTRLAFFLPTLGGGGVPRVMVNLANSMVQRGISLDMLLVQKKGPFLSQISPGVNLINLNSSRAIHSLPKVVAYLKKSAPAALLAAQNHINLVALIAKAIAGGSTRIITSLHGLFPVPGNRSIKSALNRFMTAYFYRKADAIVSVSQVAAVSFSSFTGIPQTSIDVIYNPIVTDELYVKGKEQPDHPWLIRKDKPVILAVGRLVREKRFDILIKAFSIVRNSISARLIVLGDGPQLQFLRELARKTECAGDIDLPGFFENPYSFIARADVVALASESESFGNIVAEALAFGVPVVSTACGGPTEILANGEYGKLVPVGNPEAMAEAIIESLVQPLPKQKILSGAERFRLDSICDSYLKVLLPRGDN